MKILVFFLSCLFCTQSFAKPIELVFWHAMAGSLGVQVQLLADEFNHSQSEFLLKPVYKGDYEETLTSFAAAFRAKKAPAIVQVFEVGSAMMLAPKGIIKPLEELLDEQVMQLPKEDFIASVREFYSRDGKLMAMPFNLSTPVMYFNKDLLAKLGYKDNNFPRTWAEMELLALKIKQAGFDCTYTSAYPGWILFESFLAVHGLSLIEGTPSHAVFNTPQLKAHLNRLQRWNSLHYFRYGGRVDEATILFTSGVCPLFSQSSGAFNSLTALAPFQIGVALLPLDTEISKKRYANSVGGAALWAVAGQEKQVYKGIAQFFVFLARADVQKRWQMATGYLPLGITGIYKDLIQTSKHPILLLAGKDLVQNDSGKPFNSYGPQNEIRRINTEILEALFAGMIEPAAALSLASKRVDRVLLRFGRNSGE